MNPNQNLECVTIAKQIHEMVKKSQEIRATFRKLNEAKCKAAADYDRQMAVVLIRLKNGDAIEWNGQRIENPPASYCEKIARGVCSDARLKMDTAEGLYHAAQSNLRALQAEMSCLQTINRHLDVT